MSARVETTKRTGGTGGRAARRASGRPVGAPRSSAALSNAQRRWSRDVVFAGSPRHSSSPSRCTREVVEGALALEREVGRLVVVVRRGVGHVLAAPRLARARQDDRRRHARPAARGLQLGAFERVAVDRHARPASASQSGILRAYEARPRLRDGSLRSPQPRRPPRRSRTPGALVAGSSLGGVRLGEPAAQVRAALGGSYGVCSGCARPTWYFTYRPFAQPGLGVELTGGRVSAVYTLWQPSGWHGPQGLVLGALRGRGQRAARPAPADRLPRLHGARPRRGAARVPRTTS